MSRATMSIVLSIISLMLLASLSATAQTQPEKWDYKFVQICDNQTYDAGLKKLGDEGWELVSTDDAGGACIYFFFKRPKKETYHPAPAAPAGPPTCPLTLAQAPVFRGIRLGMTTDELLALFPRSKEQSQIIKWLSDAEKNYGRVVLNFDSGTYPENKTMFGNNINDYSFTLFDGRVVRIYVGYLFHVPENRNPTWTAKSWITKLAETYKFPGPEEWMESNPNHASINCQGFRISITAGDNQASISISDPLTIDDQIKQRAEAESEKLRSELKP